MKIVVNNPEASLTEEEKADASTCSYAGFAYSEDFWQAMKNCFRVKNNEELARLEISEDGIAAYFRFKRDNNGRQ